jgi:hypothetical protein
MRSLSPVWYGLIAITGFLSTGTAHGGIIYTLDNPVQSGGVGAVLRFTGTVTNTGPESFSAGFGHTFIGVWPNAFELTFPAIIGSGFGSFGPAPGGSFTGELFDILITPSAAGLLVSGSSYLYAWPDGSNPNDFNAVKFSNAQTIQVTTVVPEPGPAALVFLAMLGGACFSLRRLDRNL